MPADDPGGDGDSAAPAGLSALPPSLGGRARLLYAAPFVAMFDRFSIGPLLLPIAHDFSARVDQVAAVATAYFLTYGAMQVFYGVVSDRFGRVFVMRAVMLGVAVLDVVAALAPNLTVLLIARALVGGLICAVFPAALVYVGDTFPFRVRQQVVVDLLASVALGTAAANLVAGVLASYFSWRLTFLLPAAGCLALTVLFRWLPESHGGVSGGVAQLWRVLARPWLVFLVVFAVAEGAVMLGLTTFLAPALEANGVPPALAGLVVAAYGLAVLLATRAVKRVAARVPGAYLIAGGGAMLVGCYLLAAWQQAVVPIFLASALAGGAYAVMHSTIQTWSTEVVPEARGTSTALFATGAFAGAGLGTAALAGLAGAGDYGRLFWIAAAITLPMVLVGAYARRRYAPTTPAGDPVPG